MMKTTICLAVLAAAPAAARPPMPPAPPAASTDAAAPKKYCVARDPATGDKLMRARCRTLAEWQRQGVELPPAR